MGIYPSRRIDMYTLNSKIKDIVKNPIGKDLIYMLLSEKDVTKYYDLIFNPLLQQFKFSHLKVLPFVDENLLNLICDKLNHYENETLQLHKGKIKKTWWKEAVCYQIYPRSFKDSNGDGIGDINGIISKLDYIKSLGVDVIWLSPIYDTPNDDNGYDIRNYKKILDEFGSMYDFDRLLAEVHLRGMKLIMDLVINHTSDEHEWFKLSRLNDETYKDYYIWRDEINNWASFFESSAWTYDESREKYYLHLFSEKQPDLNWENKRVRQDLYQIMNWWLDKGIDGFRLDVISFISKEEGLPNGHEDLAEMTGINGLEHYMYGPKVHEYLREMSQATFAHHDVMTVGECPGIGFEMSKYFVHEERQELNMIFNFDHLHVSKNKWDMEPYDANHLKNSLLRYQSIGSGCWTSLFFDSHDTPRMIGKITNNPDYYISVAKMLCLMQMTLRGTPFIYQGQEIGMSNNYFNHLDQLRDLESINIYMANIESMSEEAVFKLINQACRDQARTPMSWDDSPYGGFSSHQPWIELNKDFETVNVKKQVNDPGSVLSFYKKMIKIRKEELVLIYGKTIPVKQSMKDIMIYKRKLDKNEVMIVINLSPQTKDIPVITKHYELICSTYENHNILYKPYEGRIYRSLK